MIGIALYYGTARAPGIAKLEDEEAKEQAHAKYEENMYRRVNGAVIHCVAGDGLGVMTGMVIARVLKMSFWEEFWFEYAVGFVFGWLIFQLKSMMMMTDSKLKALAMAFRAEFFSMLTVMAGMGIVMGYITPLAATEQPMPLTYAFWGFGMLGLLLGFLFTFPMNWAMVKLGWKHGMGKPSEEHKIQHRAPRFALVASMIVAGLGVLVIPAALFERRQNMAAEPSVTMALASTRAAAPDAKLEDLQRGLTSSLETALRALGRGAGSKAMHAIDGALRAAEVGHAAMPDSAFSDALDQIRKARHALHVGDPLSGASHLRQALAKTERLRVDDVAAPSDVRAFDGAMVLDSEGHPIGELDEIQGSMATVALGGPRDVWGIWDLGAKGVVTMPTDSLIFGPSRTLGSRLVVLPTGQHAPTARR